MKREKEFSAAIDRRLSSLSGNEARRSCIRAAAQAEQKEEKPMKRMPRALVFALVAVVLLASLAIAESLNLFAWFGRQDARYAQVAPRATLTLTKAAVVEHPELGTAVASIDSAYFDGLSLSLAYRITQGQKVEEYRPTEAELAAMEARGADVHLLAFSENEPGVDILRAWNSAVAAGTPYGYRRVALYTSDHTVTEDGVDIPPASAVPLYNEQGAFCEMRDFACPLPAELRARRELQVNIVVYQEVVSCWFDGTNVYVRGERAQVGTMTAILPRNGEAREMTGTGEINGVACAVTAQVSPLAAVITFSSERPFSAFLDQPPEGTDKADCWVEVRAFDQDGQALRPQEGCGLDERSECTVVLTGTGSMPETLTVSLQSNWEGREQDAPMAGVLLTGKE